MNTGYTDLVEIFFFFCKKTPSLPNLDYSFTSFKYRNEKEMNQNESVVFSVFLSWNLSN